MRSVRTRNASSSSVDWSAQWTSSTTSNSGARVPTRSRTPSTSSSSCPVLAPAARGACQLPGSSSGSSRDSSVRAGPSRASSSAGRVVRASVRRASTSGTRGMPSAPSSTHCPRRMRKPSRSAPAAASATSRLLPHAGLAADQDAPRRPAGDVPERGGEGGHLLVAADEDRARHPAEGHRAPASVRSPRTDSAAVSSAGGPGRNALRPAAGCAPSGGRTARRLFTIEA